MWQSTLNEKGYGRLSGAFGKHTMAHRVSYRLFIGELEEDMLVCHKCDTPGCVSPFHLFKGTPIDNMKDAREKGRKPDGAHPSQKTIKEGCRCEECLKLRIDIAKSRWREYKLKNNIKSKTASTHGTASYYSNKKCRCELCVEAHRKNHHEYYIRKKAALTE